MMRNVLTDVQVAAIVLLQDPLLLVATVDLDVKVTPLSSKDKDWSAPDSSRSMHLDSPSPVRVPSSP